jgi:hypothetical protein
VIGVLGAFGDVGAHAVRVLKSFGLGPLLLGGRRSGVDCHDAASLDGFTRVCRVVVNCAGPSAEIGDLVLRAAERAGADYVDVADGPWATERVAVVGAGLQPGLMGLLPRWVARRLAQGSPRPGIPAHPNILGTTDKIGIAELAVHVAVLDRFTPTAALDYLRGTNEPLAAWRDGHAVSRAATRYRAVLPFLPDEVTVLPFLDEARRTAQALGLERGDWFSAMSGEHVLRAFDRVHSLSESDAVEALCRASSSTSSAGPRTRWWRWAHGRGSRPEQR